MAEPIVPTHRSDCAIYNEPESAAGPCDCHLVNPAVPPPSDLPSVEQSPAAAAFIAEMQSSSKETQEDRDMAARFISPTDGDFEELVGLFTQHRSLSPSRPSGETEERARLRTEIINAPETADFMAAVPLEAAHQRERWGSDHDTGKAAEDWVFLVGWLLGKASQALKSGDCEKARHHTISSAAALANWHAAITGADNQMRPGIDPAEHQPIGGEHG